MLSLASFRTLFKELSSACSSHNLLQVIPFNLAKGISNIVSAVQFDSVFGVATSSQPEVSDSSTTLDVISPLKVVLSLELQVWLGLSDAELSDEVVDLEEIKLKLVDEGSLKVKAQEMALLG